MICRMFTYLTNYLFGSQTSRKEEKMIPQPNQPETKVDFNDMKSINWNVPLIRERINELSQEIKALKKEIRSPGHEITWAEQCELGALKHRVTVYAALQAFRRNKLHFKHMSSEDQLSWLQDRLDLDDRQELAIVETAPAS